MKIAINIVGLSHNDILGIHSYKDAYINLFKNLIDPLRENNDVQIHVYTYDTSERENIIKIYDPIESTFLEEVPYDSIHMANKTYMDSLDKLDRADVDFIITTRFDLDIRVPLEIEFSKFNFLFKQTRWWSERNNHYCTSDSFHAFPKQMLPVVIEALKSTWYFSSDRVKNGIDPPVGEHPYFCPGLYHCLYAFLQKEIEPSNIHFIDNDKQDVKTSKRYVLGRFSKKINPHLDLKSRLM